MEINIDDMASEIARGIFEVGGEPGEPTQRIQFKGGDYPDHETNQGGLCEAGLILTIKTILERNKELNDK